jgi:RNA polymerase sigma-54 factor
MHLDLVPKQIQTQKLVMTPQLQQAIKLLQLSRAELAETIQQELAENPALEEAPEPKAGEGIEDPAALHDYLNASDLPSKAASGSETREFNSFEAFTASRETLADHLLGQLALTSPTAGEEQIASLIAGSLDADGYLRVSADELAEMSGCPLSRVESVLALMQSFDPPGVCARDLKECLLLQIDRLEMADSVAENIIAGHLEDLARRDYRSIARALKVSLEDVVAAARVIESLEPRPGRPFADAPPQYIEPDIFVFKIKNEFVVSLNNDGLPLLRICPFYAQALKNEKTISGEANDYMKEKLRSAQWLIRSIHQRRRTICRVMESIVKHQREFFEHGVTHLKPMVLRDVAEDIDMVESTVSRVTNNKYAHTPRGIFELKYFFTSGVESSKGGPVSATAVQDRIRRMVAAEDPRRPLSDDRIAGMLQAEGIDIARRTVAKYREKLGILASSRRRRREFDLYKGPHAKSQRRKD